MPSIDPSMPAHVQPILQGSVVETTKNKKVLTLVSNNKNVLHAEVLEHRNFFDKAFIRTKKITYKGADGESKTVHVKVNTIKSGILDLKGTKALKTLKNAEDAVQKTEQLNDVQMRIPISFVSNGEKWRQNLPALNPQQKLELVFNIEKNKEAWLAEADKKGSWITKKVKIGGPDGQVQVVKVDIFPSKRENVDKLGRIDVRMEFMGSGASKKVYQSLNYENGKVNAGLYAQTSEVKGDVESENDVRSEFELLQAKAKASGNEKIKKKIALSKGHDKGLKETKTGEVRYRSKLTQPLLKADLFSVFETNTLPDGTRLTEKIRVQLIVSAFEALEQLHAMDKVHVDIKPENLMLKEKTDPETGEKHYEVILIDLGFTTGVHTADTLNGTPGYMAPELLLQAATKDGECEYNEASDIYAMGVAFADLGQTDPWWREGKQDKNNGLILGTVLSPAYEVASNGGDYPRLGTGKHPPEVQEGLNKMTAFHPLDRFQSAKEAKEYFQNVLNNMPS